MAKLKLQPLTAPDREEFFNVCRRVHNATDDRIWWQIRESLGHQVEDFMRAENEDRVMFAVGRRIETQMFDELTLLDGSA